MSSKNLEVAPTLAQKALSVLDRILAEPSEIVELWAESDEFNAWKTTLEDLTDPHHSME